MVALTSMLPVLVKASAAGPQQMPSKIQATENGAAWTLIVRIFRFKDAEVFGKLQHQKSQ